VIRHGFVDIGNKLIAFSSSTSILLTMHIKQLVVVAAVTESAVAGLLPNTNAHYGSSPSPFKIDVDPKFIEGVRQRVATARTPTQVEGVQPIGADGPTLANFSAVTEYWAKQYDWSGVQDSINARSV
jgi:hypothetical protein